MVKNLLTIFKKKRSVRVKVLFLQSVKKSLLVGISKKAKTSLSKCPYYYLKLKIFFKKNLS